MKYYFPWFYRHKITVGKTWYSYWIISERGRRFQNSTCIKFNSLKKRYFYYCCCSYCCCKCSYSWCCCCCYISYIYQTSQLFCFPSYLQWHLSHIQNKSIFFPFGSELLNNTFIVDLYDTASTWSEWTTRVLLEIIILLDTEYIYLMIFSSSL